MNLYQAVILGLIQGLTEFLPVSSSGHLVLVPYIFNWPAHDVSFDVALHFGTALAVLIFFYKDWLNMLLALKADLFEKKITPANLLNKDVVRPNTYQLLTIFIVSLPVGVIGILFEKPIEELFRNPASTAIMLILVSFIMLFAEWFYKKSALNHKKEINFSDALIISLSQILALAPGTSRSGITISTGLFKGIQREAVARFSFLLATPIILGATLINLPDLFAAKNLTIVLIGVLVSFLSGLFAINFLMNYLKQKDLTLFIIYRVILGIIILVIVL
jgi:undecaprenyl-diphosphatase